MIQLIPDSLLNLYDYIENGFSRNPVAWVFVIVFVVAISVSDNIFKGKKDKSE